MTTPLQQLLIGLTQHEVLELEQLVDYLKEFSQDGKQPPEGSLSAVINKASPDVQDVLRILSATIDTPRNAPFKDKLSPETITDVLGLDRDATSAVKGRMDQEYITAELAKRANARGMPPQGPPSLRDQVEAAYLANGGR